MNLLTRQRAFRDYLCDAPNAAAAMIANDAETRLAVYHNAFRARLGDCLRDAFPKCWAYLGDENFAAALDQHRTRNAPNSWTLDAYGAGFDRTLARLFPNDAEVVELAWLEWALRRAFDGPDAEPLSNEALTGIDWDNSVPLIHPTAATRQITTNAAAIWTAIDEDLTPPIAEKLPADTLLLVWRRGLVPMFRSINGDERAALLSIFVGNSFGTMCEQVFAGVDADTAAPLIGGIFGNWVRDGLITGANPVTAH